jgi:hypothetical protein
MSRPEFSLKTDLVWLAGNASALGATFIAAQWMAQDGQFWIYATVISRVLLYAAAGRREGCGIFRELLNMGLVAGFVELLADYFLVHWIHSGQLVYTTHGDVVLLASPIYMPFAWACVIVEFGYLILRLAHIFKGPWVATALGASMAGATIGLYEFYAKAAGWWYYQDARLMFGKYCALYIPLGETLMFLAFFWIVTRAKRIDDPLRRAIRRGVYFGLMIFIAYAAAYFALEAG